MAYDINQILTDYKNIFSLSGMQMHKAKQDFFRKYNAQGLSLANETEVMRDLSGTQRVFRMVDPMRGSAISIDIGNGNAIVLPKNGTVTNGIDNRTDNLFDNALGQNGKFGTPTIVKNRDYNNPIIKGHATNNINDITLSASDMQIINGTPLPLQNNTTSAQQQQPSTEPSPEPKPQPEPEPASQTNQSSSPKTSSQSQTPKTSTQGAPLHEPSTTEHGAAAKSGNPNDINAEELVGAQEIKINTENAGAKIPIYHPATGASNAGLAADIGQALGLQPNDPKIAAAQTVLNPHSNIGQQNVPTHPAPTPQKQGAATGNGSSTQGGTPATGASSEPSAYAKAIQEENDRYAKEAAGFDEKRKSLLRADGDQTEALKGLETERAVAARQHGINRIQNAMDAMQGTEAFGKLYETEHLQSSGITKTGFLTSGMHYASFTEEERNGFLKSASKELGLTAEETKELKTASSSISQAYKNIWKQQAEIKSRYGESMKLVNSKDGLANMTTEQKIKHLGLTDKQVENLRKGLPMSRTGSVVDCARGFLDSTFSDVKDFFHGRMNMSNTTSSTYSQLQEARRERQLGQALDNIIIQRAKTGEWASKQTADRLAAIKRGDAAAIYDAAHAYDGPNANKTGALLREAPAAKAAAKKAAAETGGGSGIKWKGKVGAAAALLGLGAVFGTMMGHHGEQSNAQLYNPNPQPQYAN